jgi:hypothetical protein
MVRPDWAQYGARDRSQFDIGILQNFFNPIGDGGPLLHEDSPITVQIAQLPDPFGINQASLSGWPSFKSASRPKI